MKVAILSPIAWRTPPLKYGPWEQVASNIAEGMVKKGLDVTLFATGNSHTSGKLEYVSETAYAEDSSLDPKVWECLHISNVMERASEFDIIHNNFDFLPLTYSRLIDTPMVTTIHGFSSPQIIPVYKKYNSNNYYVSISDSDRSTELDYTATVYNGIDSKDFTFNEKPKDYLLFFGRIHPEKGTYESIQIAKKANMKLIISGLIQDEAYFNEKVKPYINDDDIVYVGNSGPKERDKLLGEALALLHPISFDEPFGLSVAEAMFCGTPVVAFNRGSMSELIDHSKTGYLVNNIDEAARAVNSINTIDRMHCRQRAMSNFSLEKMADGYLNVYKQILQI
ncbi:MAG: glycosyltransferase family 4 protein [Dysgonamonadaceae bacterium]|nr:glycosyltransferase family 4 protein [Dysgonamonadaceae bacterium]MDD3356353.1 glycosyltransferase family 4 protein [Dysgonamonadaceae bacterium]MDD3727763.1 glycosyltransferase family 4 protein [Dysgonamonadaceae bacterium]MDD4245557.1 glycosyltransferase family 4 protein [Dysgonamonadaceae bacterium]MDD4604983.1 glycosyltransferase family 4 protein [Dysgonamonadaceae bacterium]